TDLAGLTDIKTVTLTAKDITPPVLTPGANQNVNLNGSCSVTIPDVKGTATDNCTGTVITQSPAVGATQAAVHNGTITVTVTATDAAGNTNAKIVVITAKDTTNPVLTAGANQTANTNAGLCTASVAVTDAAFSDNCTGATIAYILSGATTKTITAGQVGTYIFNKGVTAINYTVTDAAGLTTTGSKTVTVTDTQVPTIPVLSDIIAECSVTVTAPTTTDNCDGIITGTTGVSLTFGTVGEETIYWIFTDASGNSTLPVPQKVIITDTAPVPDLGTLATQTITGCQILSISALAIPTATDVCDGTIQGTLSPGFQFPYSFNGTDTIEWEFIDSYGNISTQTQDITLIPQPVDGGTLIGTFQSTVFSDQIDISSCGEAISIALNLAGEIGAIVQWEKFAVNHGVWEVITNTNDNYTATFAIGALESTYYRVLVQVGTTCAEYSNIFYIRALPAGAAPTVKNLDLILDPNKVYCLGDPVNLLATSNYLATQETIPDSSGDFNQGQLNTQDPNGWLTDGLPGGFTAGGSATKPRNWSGKTCNNQANGSIIYCGDEGKFAIAYGNYYEKDKNGKPVYDGNIPTTLETPIMDLSNAVSASLDFDQAYYFSTNDYAIIEISTDGGATYSTLRLMHAVGSGIINWYDVTNDIYSSNDKGTSSPTEYNFNTDNTSISLAAYIGVGFSNVRIRWSFIGTSDDSAWAMDNIFVNKEVFVDTELEWTDGIGDPSEPPIATGQTEVEYSFVPEAPGRHEYGATALINGCRTYDAAGTDLVEINVTYSYAGENKVFANAECGQNTVQLNAFDNTKTSSQNNDIYEGINPNERPYPESDDDGTGEEGVWTISPSLSNSCGAGTLSNPTDPNAIFTGQAGIYVLTWTVNGCGSNITIEIQDCDKVDFDGSDDYVDFGENNYELNNDAFSIEVWVKPELLGGIQTIFSKRDANYSGNAKGYDLRIDNSGVVSFNWDRTGTIDSSPYKIDTARWYHISLTHSSSGEYKLYVDGVLIKFVGGGSPGVNNYKAILGAMDNSGSSNPLNFFNGWMDEVRIWDVALTSDQLHQMMNQKIISSPDVTGKVQGEIIPVDIHDLSWTNLKGYYQMESLGCGYLNSTTNLINGKLRNITSAQDESAPLPYISDKDGLWGTNTTWKYLGVAPNWNSALWLPPNSIGVNGTTPIDWNIVRISHNINSGNRDITLLGLLSESGELTMDGVTTMDGSINSGTGTGQGLWITHYLKLNGVIDLQGESQLIQKRYLATQFSESVFDAASSGYLERDQQGKKNSFNYNYWSSPVTLQGAANNAPFKILNVLRDGTGSDGTGAPAYPKTINFVDGAYSADTAPASIPIKITSRWIWTYKANVSADPLANYYQWVNVGYWGNINVGDGFTMKGTGGAAAINVLQNYVFKGKPNSGDIQTTQLNPGQIYLIGNPYPSALDANEFILDNLAGRRAGNVFNGALYFWDHFGLSNNHLLAQYEGGYATYNLMGGVKAIANVPLTSQTNVQGSKIPERFIPVGQGFFVEATLPMLSGSGTITPGNLYFKNSQRVFQREVLPTGPANNGSVFMKSATSKKSTTQETQETNADLRPKVRLQFDSPLGYRRPLLVGMDENTSNQFDIGYDAPLNESNKEDMFWQLGKGKLVIQGVNNFNEDQELPMGLKISKAGLANIKIEKLENMDDNLSLFIKDKFTGKTHNISQKPFEIMLEPGEYLDRFALVFKIFKLVENDVTSGVLVVEPLIEDNNYYVFMNNTIAELQIKNNGTDEIRSVALYNNLGQTMNTWNADLNRRIISLPVKLATGVYIVQINTINGTVNRKIIIE
ncbi:MAG: T9SS type A sorting domain-containing protein, partial [Gelidibacter sp.]|nr:T9SS type A sorting domain-containing protein [Gelidibacter sp.]